MRPATHARFLFLTKASACLLLGISAITAQAARKPHSAEPAPTTSIDMEPLGFRRISDRILQSGRSTLTVDFAGPNRLLVSFLSRGLIRRDPEATEQDHDRQVEVFVLELPGGKPVAHALWRLHDEGQYLWPLGDGRFLVRERGRLRLIDPRKPGEEALASHPVFEAGNGRQLASVTVTPDGSLIEVQTMRGKLIGDDLDLQGDPDRDRTKGFDIRFFTIPPDSESLILRAHTSTAEEFNPPFNSEGFLTVDQEDSAHFGFDLHLFVGGGKRELAGLETSCAPSASFLASNRFIIAACRGGDAPTMTGVLDTAGNVLWLGPDELSPWVTFSSAPDVGRFAIRKTVSTVVLASPSSLVPETIVRPRSQAVQVRRINTGEELLTITGLPISRAPQNFALSRDGLKLAVWRDSSVAVYQLPPVTAKDTETPKH